MIHTASNVIEQDFFQYVNLYMLRAALLFVCILHFR